MPYFSKDTILSAYKTLSTLSADPTKQGATQRVSALRYMLALDMFYKKTNQECDTTDRRDKDLYIRFVGNVVSIDNQWHTANFHTNIKDDQDYAVGSNFFSVNVVKLSNENTEELYEFPRRGSNPLFNVENGNLIENDKYFRNIREYIRGDKYLSALMIWILRSTELESNQIYESCKTAYSRLFTANFVQHILPSKQGFESYFLYSIKGTTSSSISTLQHTDILSLFDTPQPIITTQHIENMATKPNDNNTSVFQSALPIIKDYQSIYFGAPGTGKSTIVKKLSEKIPNRKVFRTTFHPDYDYSTFVGTYKPLKIDGELSYEFCPQVFTNAYVYAYNNPNTNVVLIIEEINRGNCAQIFGDIFQLLDRKDDGSSMFPIDVESDFANYLIDELGEDSKGIKDNQICLPRNLFFIATMNTSDQSLYPMDSAFRRRWSWNYVPISYNNPISSNYQIIIGADAYQWNKFLQSVNDKIRLVTDSEDKQMGNFFIKQSIDKDVFKNKIMFYLWNEICKDEYNTERNFFRRSIDKEIKEFSYSDLFNNDDIELIQGFMEFLNVEKTTE